MVARDYQKAAMRTCSIPYDDKQGMLYHAIFGLASEAGEAAGILQKQWQGHEFDPVHMKKDLVCFGSTAESVMIRTENCVVMLILMISKKSRRMLHLYRVEWGY